MARKTQALVLAQTSGGTGGVRPQMQPERAYRWTEAKQSVFVTQLAITCNVREALAATGMSAAGLYVLRKRSAPFRAAWDEALAEGYARLEAMLLDRAMNGKAVRIERDGAVTETREHSDALALTLLGQHRKSVVEIRARSASALDDPERILARVVERIERIARAAGRA